jgi:hypothetical protein
MQIKHHLPAAATFRLSTGLLSRRRALAGLCLAWPVACAAATDSESPPLQPQKVADGIWFVQGETALGTTANRNFISNAGFVITGDGVVVIDALGSPSLGAELIASIRRLTREPIRYVIVTHYHADHVYGLQAFKDVGAEIIAYTAGREYLNSDTARLRLEAGRKDLSPWIDEKTRLVPADRWTQSCRSARTSFASAMSGPHTRRKTWRFTFQKPAFCSLEIWCFAAAFPLLVSPTAVSGSSRSGT